MPAFTVRSAIRVCCLGLLAAGCATVNQEVAAPAAATTPTALGDALARGDAARANDHPRVAVTYYSSVLREDPGHERAGLGLAEAYLSLGLSRQALAQFEAIASAGDAGIRLAARQGRGIALLLLGDDEPARQVLSAVVADDPSQWRAWNALGRAYDQQRQWQQAESAYRRALAASPTPFVVHNNWGMSLLSQERYAEAAEQFGRARDFRPDSAMADRNLRLALALQGRYEEALSGVGEGELPAVLNNVGYAAMTRGDYDRARECFSKSISKSPRFNEVAWRNLQYLSARVD